MILASRWQNPRLRDLLLRWARMSASEVESQLLSAVVPVSLVKNLVLLQIAATLVVGLLVCSAHTALAQRLDPVSSLRPAHDDRVESLAPTEAIDSVAPANTMPRLFEKTHSPRVDFTLELGDLAGNLLSDSEFRQFKRSIVDDRWDQRQDSSANRFQQRRADVDSQVGQATYWQDTASRPAEGFAAMGQPRVESFPPITAEAEPEATASSRRFGTTEQQQTTALQAELPPDAAMPNVGVAPVGVSPPVAAGPTAPGQVMGPALPEGGAADVPISEQELGQLHEQIQIQQRAAESETGEEQARHLLLLENARKALAQANKYMLKDIKQQARSSNFEQEKDRLMGHLEKEREKQMPAPDATADELFVQLEQLRAELAERNERLREVNKSDLLHKKRMEKIPGERTKANSDLADIIQQMKDQENGDDNVYALVMLRSQQLELEYRLKALGSESKLHEFENRLLPMRGDELSRDIKFLEIEIDAWNHAANEHRRKEIAEEVRLARLKAIEAAPALKTLANTNAKLIQLRAEFAEKIRLASEEDLEVQSVLNTVKNHHETAEKSIVGSTYHETNGILMVEIRRQLPTPFRSQARIVEIESDLRQINLEQLELNEKRRPLSHPFEYVEQRLAGAVAESMSGEDLKETALKFVEGIRLQYDQLSSAHHDYSELLRKIVAERKELVSEIESTKKFVDEQTLWIQSAKPIGYAHLTKTQTGAQEFFDPVKWYSLFNSLTNRMFHRPHESAVGLMGLVGLFVVSRRFKG